MVSEFTEDKPSLNARVSAVALVVGGLSLFVLSTLEYSLAPLRLLTLAIITFGIWAFCDEMGMRKPLIRAGFVFFIFAIFARSTTLLEPVSDSIGRYYLLYAFALLISMFIWSVAYLHRQRDLKYAGALGAVATITPLIALIVGHVVVGAGAYMGIDSLLAAAEGKAMNTISPILTIDKMFVLWAGLTAWFLWKGHIKGLR